MVLERRDAISANVLTWSAAEMLRGVAKNQGLVTFQAQLETRIKPEFLSRWRDKLKAHYNYFKHADRDPDRIIPDFTPEATTWALFGACHDYKQIYGERTFSMLIYQMWFLTRHPEITNDDMAALAQQLAEPFGFPAAKSFETSTDGEAEVLRMGRLHPQLLEQLGPIWLNATEPEISIM